jgi:hypothetical protein
LLATAPAVSPIVDDDRLTDYRRFTPVSRAGLFGEVFEVESVRVRAYWNVLAAVSFLVGLAQEELTAQEFEIHDHRFATVTSVRVASRMPFTKSKSTSSACRPSAGAQWPRSFARAGKPHRALSARGVDRLSAAGFELGFHTRRHDLPSTLDHDALSAPMTAGANCSRRPSGARSR